MIIELDGKVEVEAVVNNNANDRLNVAIIDIVNSITNKQYPHVKSLIEITSMMMSDAPPTEACLSKWLRDVFSDTRIPQGPSYASTTVVDVTGKKKRRQEYAMTQKLYKKDFKNAARQILTEGETPTMTINRRKYSGRGQRLIHKGKCAHCQN